MSKIPQIILAASAAFATLTANVSMAEVAKSHSNSYIATADGVQLYYKDWRLIKVPPKQYRQNWPISMQSSLVPRRALATCPDKCATSSTEQAGSGPRVLWLGKSAAACSPQPGRAVAKR